MFNQIGKKQRYIFAHFLLEGVLYTQGYSIIAGYFLQMLTGHMIKMALTPLTIIAFTYREYKVKHQKELLDDTKMQGRLPWPVNVTMNTFDT